MRGRLTRGSGRAGKHGGCRRAGLVVDGVQPCVSSGVVSRHEIGRHERAEATVLACGTAGNLQARVETSADLEVRGLRAKPLVGGLSRRQLLWSLFVRGRFGEAAIAVSTREWFDSDARERSRTSEWHLGLVVPSREDVLERLGVNSPMPQ